MAIFGIAKNGIWSKNKFRKIDLFDFTSFFGLDFFLIFWPTMYELIVSGISGYSSSQSGLRIDWNSWRKIAESIGLPSYVCDRITSSYS